MKLLERAARAIAGCFQTPDMQTVAALKLPVPRVDRRRSMRVEVEANLTVETEDGHRYSGYCRDLSGEGAAALIFGRLMIGEKILLAVHDPLKARPTVLRAEVRQVYGMRYGLEFVEHSAQEVTDFMVATCRTCTA